MRKIAEIELGGKNRTVKINNMTIANAEKQLGKGMMAVLNEGMSVEALHTLLWLGMRNFERKMTLKEVYEMVEDSLDDGSVTFTQLLEFVLDLVMNAMGLAEQEEDSGNSTGTTKSPKPSESA